MLVWGKKDKKVYWGCVEVHFWLVQFDSYDENYTGYKGSLLFSYFNSINCTPHLQLIWL